MPTTFIIDCPWCKAKVAAIQQGKAERSFFDDDAGEPFGSRLYVGHCPNCSSLLAGESTQIAFEGIDAHEDEWSDVVRVYPKPPKSFLSSRIPNVVRDSLSEADRSLQAGANIAACVMLGRTLEAVCQDVLKAPEEPNAKSNAKEEGKSEIRKRRMTLAEGITRLRDKGVIDARLFEWSQQLRAFRNLAAHPEDISISRQDAEDLQTFVYAIIEYIYDLTDRYEEFKARAEKTRVRKKPKT